MYNEILGSRNATAISALDDPMFYVVDGTFTAVFKGLSSMIAKAIDDRRSNMKICSIEQKEHLFNLFHGLELDALQRDIEISSGLLDVFPKELSATEAQEINFSTLYKKYEDKIKLFFHKVFESNNYVIYVKRHVIINTSRNYLTKKDFSSLETKFVKKFINYEDNLLQVNDYEELVKILVLSIREVVLSDFFTNDIAIQGNFDLSFPVFCRSEKSKKLIKEYATESKLYIR